VNILRILSTWFLWWIFPIWRFFFKKKNLYLGFDIFINVLTFLCPWHNKSIVTPLFHNKTNTMITLWDAMEYAIHTHYTQFLWNLKFQTSYMNFEINSYFNFENSYFEWKIYSSFWRFLFEYESSNLNSENYYFNLKNWFSIIRIFIWFFKSNFLFKFWKLIFEFLNLVF
jgi:hypothetical protein